METKSFHVLVALSLEPDGAAVLEQAQQFVLQLNNSVLDIVHVAPNEASGFVSYDIGPESVRESVAHHLRDERREIQSLRDRLVQAGISVGQILTVRGDDIASLIATEAKRLNADILVVGPSHHHGLFGWLSTGATDKIIAQPPCKVLVVPTE
jgi:nucleotide-binding universal stress UspA family protein